MTPIERSRRDERLCAYLFGELDAAEREALERELAASPELRAEHDRLAATIALVRDAVPAEEALPASARARLAAAAAEGPARGGRVLRWSRPLAAAAAVVVVVGAAALSGLWVGGPETASEDVAFRYEAFGSAPAPAAERPRGPGLEDELVAGRKALGGDARDDAAPREGETLAKAGAVRESGPNAKGAEDPRDAGMRGLGYLGRGEPRSEAAAGPAAASPGTRANELAEGAAVRLGEARQAPPAAGPAPEAAEQRAARARLAPGSGAGAYRGPGDSGPPAEGGAKGAVLDGTGAPARARPTAGGPASPGPDPAAPRTVAATEEQEMLRLLGALGYGADGGGGAVAPAEPALPPVAGERVALGVELDRLEALGYADREGADADDYGRPDGWYLGQGRRPVAPREPVDVDAVCRRVLQSCRVRPSETPDAMFFRYWGDHPFELARLDPLSTFSVDVDTASWPLARAYLDRGLVPEREQVRTEEFVNYFDSGVEPPSEDVFRIHMDLAPSPFGSADHWMLRVVLRGKEVDRLERQDLALTFVVDVSGSMARENRLGLVQHAMRLLVGELYPSDAVAIVAFSNEARVVLPMTSAGSRGAIEQAIHSLSTGGGTNAAAGLRTGYALAAEALTPRAANRVVLLSDGVANIGATDQASMLAQVAEERAQGIYLNTIGVGIGNHNDALLEQLADRGDGMCSYVDSPDEAYRAIVERFTGAFQPIARDVKVQLDFDPAQVESYRQLGYENRAIADADFRVDSVDAGEVGAGHQVTALYELRLAPGAGDGGPLVTTRVRFKPPFAVDAGRLDAAAREEAEVAREIEASLSLDEAAVAFRGTRPHYQAAVLVAQLAELLRKSVHARGDSYALLVAETKRVARELRDPSFAELARLVEEHRDAIVAALPDEDDPLAEALDAYARRHYLLGQLELLRRDHGEEPDEDLLDRLDRENAELEERIRRLLEERLVVPDRPR